ncbi:hypothetical protein CHLNCDRAFT_142874 [Chlorella variabilis]|uniref:FATC domain-containing protein n=1 Tax=Chlorella variabilis TaxID=554065 RepID=E1Z8Y5_CHLVA|nr:hypothetical protein CHLNCDRAFT_142874 [Chlorella variabilis]EFN57684.1 hypothetical protein CHLNCDRAFT_142874 [Chlorella variabilis]|eukprot:XP_005849786.1 hypothetical protein CHLNCDRAFT_142874 [Chlorella variabilis]
MPYLALASPKHARPAGLRGPGGLALHSTRLRRLAAAGAPPAGPDPEQAGARPSGPAQARAPPSQPDWYKAKLNRFNQEHKQAQERIARERLHFQRVMRSGAVLFLLMAGIGFPGMEYGMYMTSLMRALLRIKQKLEGVEAGKGKAQGMEGQVQQLLQDAQDRDKLCRMYVGWQAWC